MVTICVCKSSGRIYTCLHSGKKQYCKRGTCTYEGKYYCYYYYLTLRLGGSTTFVFIISTPHIEVDHTLGHTLVGSEKSRKDALARTVFKDRYNQTIESKESPTPIICVCVWWGEEF